MPHEENEDMYNTINDCHVEIFDIKPTKPEIHSIAAQIPDSIKWLASQWGWNDTEVGDKLYVWIRDVY